MTMDKNIKIVMFTDGTEVICQLEDFTPPGGEQAICFLFRYPFWLRSKILEDGQPGARLEAYSQFSSDTLVRVPYGEIRSVLNPRPFLEEKYIEHVSAYNPAWAEDLKDKSNDPNAAIQVPEEVKEEVTNES